MDNYKNYDLQNCPQDTFESWLAKAQDTDKTPEAMTLSTLGKNGEINARMVLYKGREGEKWAIYTNLKSQKAIDLLSNPIAALTLWWPGLGRQVRINGATEQMESKIAKKYFHSRDKNSQVASYISQQSSPINSREELEEKFFKAQKEFENSEVPFPEKNWGGFWFIPEKYEFFIYRDFRLNDRFLYSRADKDGEGPWEIQRLQP